MTSTKSDIESWCEMNAFSQLTSMPVVGATRSIGSNFFIHIGNWKSYTRADGKLGRKGSWSLFVGPCYWVFSKSVRRLCTSDTLAKKIDTFLPRIEGRKIDSIGFAISKRQDDDLYAKILKYPDGRKYSPEFFDLVIEFDNGLILSLLTKEADLLGHQYSIWRGEECMLSAETKVGITSKQWSDSFYDGKDMWSK